jgi:hypothetical protein
VFFVDIERQRGVSVSVSLREQAVAVIILEGRFGTLKFLLRIREESAGGKVDGDISNAFNMVSIRERG